MSGVLESTLDEAPSGRSIGPRRDVESPPAPAMKVPGCDGYITSGNNGHYKAVPGWDPCTGLGVPNGAALQKTTT